MSLLVVTANPVLKNDEIKDQCVHFQFDINYYISRKKFSTNLEYLYVYSNTWQHCCYPYFGIYCKPLQTKLPNGISFGVF